MAKSNGSKYMPLALLLLIAFYFWNKAKQTASAYAYTSPGVSSNAYTYNSALTSLSTLATVVGGLFKGSGSSSSASAPVVSSSEDYAGDGNDYSLYEADDLG